MMAGMLTPTVCEMWPIVGWVFFLFWVSFLRTKKPQIAGQKTCRKWAAITLKNTAEAIAPKPNVGSAHNLGRRKGT